MAAPLRLGSLCSGYGGLDLAAEQVLGAETVWHCQYDPDDKHQYAARILARHWDVPNHGDITAIDWSAVEPVDVLTAGFPCQDVSSAGKRAGIAPGTRSGLWLHVARAIEVLQPSAVVIENVRGLLSARAHSDMEPCPWCLGEGDDKPALRALGAVLGDLASLGLDAEWHGLPAAAVGCAHERFRVIVLAWPAHSPRPRLQGPRLPGRPAQHGRAAADPDRLGGQRHRTGGQPPQRHLASTGGPAADPQGIGAGEPADQALSLAGGRDAREVPRGGGRHPAAHPQGDRRQQGRPQPARQQRGPDTPLGSSGTAADPDGRAVREQPLSQPGSGAAPLPGVPGSAAADAAGERHRNPRASGQRGLSSAVVAGGPAAAADPDRWGQQGLSVGDGQAPADDLADADGPGVAWGPYAAAVARWEHALGRPAPAPVDGAGRLAPVFVEWLMGLPAGWVTDTPGLPRSAQLKALGNGVVPQQAVAALHLLIDRIAEPPATGTATERTAA